MNSNLNGQKVIKTLEAKRNDINFVAYKILATMLHQYETRLEKDPSNVSDIIYRCKKPNPDLYNRFDLDQLTRSNGKYNLQSRTFYYMTVVQVLDQIAFGINGVNISVMKNNNSHTTNLHVPRKLMDAKYELVKVLVNEVKPIIDKGRMKKNKKENNNNNGPKKTVIVNDELVVPMQKLSIELEDNSNLPTVL